MDMTFGQIVREQRYKNNWTVREFIKKLGDELSPAYITKIEKHGEVPAPYLVKKMADVFIFDENTLIAFAMKDKIERYILQLQKDYGVILPTP